MNIDDYLEEYCKYYSEGQEVFIIVTEPSGKEYRATCTYVGGNVIQVNELETIVIPMFSCPQEIPSGRKGNVKITPIPGPIPVQGYNPI